MHCSSTGIQSANRANMATRPCTTISTGGLEDWLSDSLFSRLSDFGPDLVANGNKVRECPSHVQAGACRVYDRRRMVNQLKPRAKPGRRGGVCYIVYITLGLLRRQVKGKDTSDLHHYRVVGACCCRWRSDASRQISLACKGHALSGSAICVIACAAGATRSRAILPALQR